MQNNCPEQGIYWLYISTARLPFIYRGLIMRKVVERWVHRYFADDEAVVLLMLMVGGSCRHHHYG